MGFLLKTSSQGLGHWVCRLLPRVESPSTPEAHTSFLRTWVWRRLPRGRSTTTPESPSLRPDPTPPTTSTFTTLVTFDLVHDEVLPGRQGPHFYTTTPRECPLCVYVCPSSDRCEGQGGRRREITDRFVFTSTIPGSGCSVLTDVFYVQVSTLYSWNNGVTTFKTRRSKQQSPFSLRLTHHPRVDYNNRPVTESTKDFSVYLSIPCPGREGKNRNKTGQNFNDCKCPRLSTFLKKLPLLLLLSSFLYNVHRIPFDISMTLV